MNRNDVYEYTLGNRLCRIAIVSASAFNPDRATYAVILGADTPPPRTAAAVPLAPADPERGTVDLSRLRPVDPRSTGRRIGRLSASTIGRVDTALRHYLGL